MLFTRSQTDITTSCGSFINTWSYIVDELVMFDRRKAASAWLNQVVGSEDQKSGSLTATALTWIFGCCCGGAGACYCCRWSCICCIAAFTTCSPCWLMADWTTAAVTCSGVVIVAWLVGLD